MEKIDIAIAAARNLKDLIIDAKPGSLTGSTLDFAKLIHPISGQLKGRFAYIYSGGGAGQERVISDFTPANNRCEFAEVFSTSPSTNSDVLLTKYWSYSEYKNSVDRMMGQARTKFLEEKVATMELVATQYAYNVPSGFEQILSLRFVPSGHTDYAADDEVDRIFELPPRYWSIERNVGGTYQIILDPRKINLDNFDEQMVHVLGQAKPDILGTDNATVLPELEEYLINGTCMLMASQRIDENRQWLYKYRMFKDLYDELDDYIFRHRYGQRVGA